MFQSTRPVWGATTPAQYLQTYHQRFQSTRPVWGATVGDGDAPVPAEVSIHAPRVGRDLCLKTLPTFRTVSIHAPRVGRDIMSNTAEHMSAGFNPRAPCGARQASFQSLKVIFPFQSTRPVWGATIGTMRRESTGCFNPRAPCGARPFSNGFRYSPKLFQSTRPVWGATAAVRTPCQGCRVSIHAPRVGRDQVLDEIIKQGRVSIHAPRVGRDRGVYSYKGAFTGFNPRAPCGARRRGNACLGK